MPFMPFLISIHLLRQYCGDCRNHSRNCRFGDIGDIAFCIPIFDDIAVILTQVENIPIIDAAAGIEIGSSVERNSQH